VGERNWMGLGVRLLVAVVLVGLGFSYLTAGHGGERDFQKALEAMKQVRSVRVARSLDISPNQHGDASWDLVCDQDAYRYAFHMVGTDPNNPGDVTQEEIHVGSTDYEHKPDDTWQAHRFPNGVRAASTFCAALAQGTDSTVLPDIATMIRRGILEKGDKKTVNGVACREWKVTLRVGANRMEHDTLCLGLDDHLPYEMVVDWKRTRTVYSDYNAPFQLDLPGPELQAASATSGSN